MVFFLAPIGYTLLAGAGVYVASKLGGGSKASAGGGGSGGNQLFSKLVGDDTSVSNIDNTKIDNSKKSQKTYNMTDNSQVINNISSPNSTITTKKEDKTTNDTSSSTPTSFGESSGAPTLASRGVGGTAQNPIQTTQPAKDSSINDLLMLGVLGGAGLILFNNLSGGKK